MKHLYETVAENILAHIEQGVYRSGERLPGIRRLSQQLNVSVSTALEAYRLLEDQGRIQARARFPRSHALRGNAVKGALRRESRPASCVWRTRDAARPALHSHAARRNERYEWGWNNKRRYNIKN